MNLTGAEVIETSLPVLYWFSGQTLDMAVALGECSQAWPDNTWRFAYGNAVWCPDYNEIEGMYADFTTETAGWPLLPGWHHVTKSEYYRSEDGGVVGYARGQNGQATHRSLYSYVFIREIRPDRLRGAFFLVSRPNFTGADTVPGTKLFIVHFDAVAYPPSAVSEDVDDHLRRIRQTGGLEPATRRWRREWVTHDGAAGHTALPHGIHFSTYDTAWPWDSITDPDIRDRLYRAYSPGDLWPGGANDTDAPADTGAASDTGAPTDTATPSP